MRLIKGENQIKLFITDKGWVFSSLFSSPDAISYNNAKLFSQVQVKRRLKKSK